MAKIGLESVRVYVAGENIWLWSSRKGLDPRMSLAGSFESNTRYSAIRNFSGGVRVVF